MARFTLKNRVMCSTTTTGTGSYAIGSAVVGRQSFTTLSDGAFFPYRCEYGSNWECGIGTKRGNLVERTYILESSTGGRIDWVAGSKTIAIDWLAQNVLESSDGSITIEDKPSTGKTDIKGLRLSDVITWAQSNLLSGKDIAVVKSGDSYTINVSRQSANTTLSTSGSAPYTATLNFQTASIQRVSLGASARLAFSNFADGQEALICLDYTTSSVVVTWPDELNAAVIDWVNGYEPTLTPVSGSKDVFKFVRTGSQTITVNNQSVSVPKYLAWILTTERSTLSSVTSLCDVTASITTTTQGVNKGPNAKQWLSATVDCDFYNYFIRKSGTVSGGTFDLTIGSTTNWTIADIPFDVTAAELLDLIYEGTDLTPLQVNVHGLANRVGGSATVSGDNEVQIEFLGESRYTGWVISCDSTNLSGGGEYTVDAEQGGTGSDPWPFTVGASYSGHTVRFKYGSEQTSPIAVNSTLQQVQDSLQALPSIGPNNLIVRYATIGIYVFEFVGDLRSQDIVNEIEFVTPPSSSLGAASGQSKATSQKGAGPTGADEIQELSISGTPVAGSITLTILGEDVEIPYNSTTSRLVSLVNTALGETAISATGGPLPNTPIVITFINERGYTNVADSSVDASETGTAIIDWSIADRFLVTLAEGSGTYKIQHKNVIPGKRIAVTLTSDAASGSLSWTGISVDWGSATLPTIPADGESTSLEFYGESTTDIKGRKFFHTGEGGSVSEDDITAYLVDHLNPGVGIEIDHDSNGDIFTIDSLETIKNDTYASTITLDLSANVGQHHQITLTGNTTLALTNQKLGEKFRVLITQGGAGGHTVTWWSGLTWADGFTPALTPVPGKSDLFEFLVRRLPAPYVAADYLGWVETEKRPKFVTLTETGATVNEVQHLTCNGTPTGGTWSVTFEGVTTPALSHNITASALQSALQALSTIGVGNVQVSGGTLGVSPFVVVFVGSLGGQNVSRLLTSSSLVF